MSEAAKQPVAKQTKEEKDAQFVAEQVVDPSKDVILILEDSLPNRNILKNIISKLGFAVLVGEHGKHGVALLQRCINEKLKLVACISDFMMPEMGGAEFLKHVRETEQTKNLPFVIVSAISEKSYILEAMKSGISGYLLKPIDLEQIKTKLKQLFPDKIK